MITITTNKNNDIFVDATGNLATKNDIEALANVSVHTVLTALGEPEFNQTDGIPYFQTIFTDTPQIELFQAAIISALESLESVQRVSDFEYTQNNGVFSYSLKEHTIYGDIVLNG